MHRRRPTRWGSSALESGIRMASCLTANTNPAAHRAGSGPVTAGSRGGCCRPGRGAPRTCRVPRNAPATAGRVAESGQVIASDHPPTAWQVSGLGDRRSVTRPTRHTRPAAKTPSPASASRSWPCRVTNPTGPDKPDATPGWCRSCRVVSGRCRVLLGPDRADASDHPRCGSAPRRGACRVVGLVGWVEGQPRLGGRRWQVVSPGAGGVREESEVVGSDRPRSWYPPIGLRFSASASGPSAR
jgi:hypothetical protein